MHTRDRRVIFILMLFICLISSCNQNKNTTKDGEFLNEPANLSISFPSIFPQLAFNKYVLSNGGQVPDVFGFTPTTEQVGYVPSSGGVANDTVPLWIFCTDPNGCGYMVTGVLSNSIQIQSEQQSDCGSPDEFSKNYGVCWGHKFSFDGSAVPNPIRAVTINKRSIQGSLNLVPYSVPIIIIASNFEEYSVPFNDPIAILYVSIDYLRDPNAAIHYTATPGGNPPGPTSTIPKYMATTTYLTRAPYIYTGVVWQRSSSVISLGPGASQAVTVTTSTALTNSNTLTSGYSLASSTEVSGDIGVVELEEKITVGYTKSWGNTYTTADTTTNTTTKTCNNPSAAEAFCVFYSEYLANILNVPGMAEITVPSDPSATSVYNIFDYPSAAYKKGIHTLFVYPGLPTGGGVQQAVVVPNIDSEKYGIQVPIGAPFGAGVLSTYMNSNDAIAITQL